MENINMYLFERVKMLIKMFDTSNGKNYLAQELGVNPRTLRGYLCKNREANLWPLLDNILACHSKLSRTWLYFGEGPMLLDDIKDTKKKQRNIANYNKFFCANVTWLMQQKKLLKLELAEAADISVAFVSDITTGKGNPSLRIMTSIAAALDVPLQLLLFDPDGDVWSFVLASAKQFQTENHFSAKDKGDLVEVTVILPRAKAFAVKKLATATHTKKKK